MLMYHVSLSVVFKGQFSAMTWALIFCEFGGQQIARHAAGGREQGSGSSNAIAKFPTICAKNIRDRTAPPPP